MPLSWSQLEALSFSLQRQTVVVLDNAPAHVAKRVQERRGFWQQRGLWVFYLPPYSPHLNIVEVLWRKLKYQWLQPQDYLETQTLFIKCIRRWLLSEHCSTFTFAPFRIGLN